LQPRGQVAILNFCNL